MKISVKKERALKFYEANHLLRYEADTGKLFWRVSRRRRSAGSEAGSISSSIGYCVITVNGRTYLAHRIAWLLHYGKWPKGSIDHINAVKIDNRSANLRLADFSENGANRKAQAKHGIGSLKGTSFSKSRKKWRAAIRVHGKIKNLGDYQTEVEAHMAYFAAATTAFGSFARSA